MENEDRVVGGEWFPVAAAAYGGSDARLMGARALLHMLESCSKVKQDSILDDYSMMQDRPLRSQCCTACLKRLARSAAAK